MVISVLMMFRNGNGIAEIVLAKRTLDIITAIITFLMMMLPNKPLHRMSIVHFALIDEGTNQNEAQKEKVMEQ